MRDAALMRVVKFASSPLNPAAVEELIEAGVPLTGASWLSRALSAKNPPPRRVLFSSSNYHVWPEMFVDLFGGTFVSAEYQRGWQKLN